MSDRLETVLLDVKAMLDIDTVSIDSVIAAMDDIYCMDYNDWLEFKFGDEYVDWIRVTFGKEN